MSVIVHGTLSPSPVVSFYNSKKREMHMVKKKVSKRKVKSRGRKASNKSKVSKVRKLKRLAKAPKRRTHVKKKRRR